MKAREFIPSATKLLTQCNSICITRIRMDSRGTNLGRYTLSSHFRHILQMEK